MKKILQLLALLVILASCGNKTYYENDKKVAQLIDIENGIARIKRYDFTLNSSEDDFVRRMKKILHFYDLEDYIFELYSAVSLDEYKMDIHDLLADEFIIIDDILLQEDYTTDEYRKYETSDYLSNEGIIKVCESNKRTSRERKTINFNHKRNHAQYASAYKNNNFDYTITLSDEGVNRNPKKYSFIEDDKSSKGITAHADLVEIYKAEHLGEKWDIKEILDNVVCDKHKDNSSWIYNIGGITLKMIEVKGGTFYMGATKEHKEHATIGEKPVHKVTLSDYYIGECEVTQDLWELIMGSNPSEHRGDLSRPVENINKRDCLIFIERLNAITQEQFCLPTEAQWEYAARGGHKSQQYIYSGSNDIEDVGWCKSNSGGTSHCVKEKKPNALGLYDMSGNVWEFCSDFYYNYSDKSLRDPLVTYGKYHVLRGGSYSSQDRVCRTSYRISGNIGYKSGGYGLRLCLKK